MKTTRRTRRTRPTRLFDMMKPDTQRLVASWTRWTIAAFALFAAAVLTTSFFNGKFHRTTGNAKWIWVEHRLSSGDPVAFFAVRDFEVVPDRQFVRLSVAGDPQYTLYFNGTAVGGARARASGQVALDVYDVTDLAVPGTNRAVVALRSGNGVGGLLLALDAGPMRENIVVSDGRWEIHRSWSPALLIPGRAAPGAETPRVYGEPPIGRWNYPAEREGERFPEKTAIEDPGGAVRFATTLPKISVISGVAVLGSEPVVATAWDFGMIEGRGRLTRRSGEGQQVVRVRYAHSESDLARPGEVDSFVFADGESVVVDPEKRAFRYMIVYGSDAQASVVREVRNSADS